MHLVLSLPGLLAPDTKLDSPAPRLARLLALAGAPAREPDGLDAALAARYGIARGRDWPLAPIRAAALGVDVGNAYWLAADPVTLEAERDDVRLVGAVRDLEADDARALVTALNAHFATDGLEFVAARPDAWFVRSAKPVALATRPLAVVAGRMVRDLMPTGADAGTWRRWQNESEMLLHAHPVNALRERAGRAPVNGIWFSDGGTLPPRTTAADGIHTHADGGIAVALAVHAGAPAHRLPDGLAAALAEPTSPHTIVVALAAPVAPVMVERAWAQPASQLLARGALETVTIVADGDDGAAAWATRRPGPLRRVALSFARPDLARMLAAARERA